METKKHSLRKRIGMGITGGLISTLALISPQATAQGLETEVSDYTARQDVQKVEEKSLETGHNGLYTLGALGSIGAYWLLVLNGDGEKRRPMEYFGG